MVPAYDSTTNAAQPSYNTDNKNNTVSRSSTFSTKSTTEIAQQRVHQLSDHLSRSNTMASQDPVDSPAHDAPVSAPEALAAPAPEKQKENVELCRFCQRPSKCPNCDHELDPPKEKDGAVDIDAERPDTAHQLPSLPDPLPPQHKDYVHCTPPEPITARKFSVFLAGSIEMGRAVQWQRQLALQLRDLPIAVYNPRRGHWNPTTTQLAKDKAFRAQVNWELGALTEASVICFFFDTTTMSPVTMCELGLWAHSGKIVVCCGKEFWKGGNVHIVCERYGVPLVQDYRELEELVRAMLKRQGMMLDANGDLTEDKAKEDASKLPDTAVLEEKKARPPVDE